MCLWAHVIDRIDCTLLWITVKQQPYWEMYICTVSSTRSFCQYGIITAAFIEIFCSHNWLAILFAIALKVFFPFQSHFDMVFINLFGRISNDPIIIWRNWISFLNPWVLFSKYVYFVFSLEKENKTKSCFNWTLFIHDIEIYLNLEHKQNLNRNVDKQIFWRHPEFWIPLIK